MYHLPFQKAYKSQFTQDFSEIVAIATSKPHAYTGRDDQGEIIRGKIYEKELKGVN